MPSSFSNLFVRLANSISHQKNFVNRRLHAAGNCVIYNSVILFLFIYFFIELYCDPRDIQLCYMLYNSGICYTTVLYVIQLCYMLYNCVICYTALLYVIQLFYMLYNCAIYCEADFYKTEFYSTFLGMRFVALVDLAYL